jgi:hypothetical protein
VWRADHVRNSVSDGHFGHFYGSLEGVGTVVEAREDVAVDVDHGFRFL